MDFKALLRFNSDQEVGGLLLKWPQAALLGAASGGLLALCFPFLRWSWLSWIALVPFFWAVRRSQWRSGLVAGASCGLVFHLISLSWIGVFGSFALLGLAIEKAILPAILGFALSSRRNLRPLAFAALAACLWIGTEYLQTLGVFGMTWGMLAQTKARLPIFLQINALFGMWGLGWLIAWVNAVIAELAWPAVKKMPQGAKDALIMVAVAIALIAATLLYGAWELDHQPTAAGPAQKYGVVQLSTPQEEKFHPGFASRNMGQLRRQTRKCVREGAETVIWPETSVPYRGFLAMPDERQRLQSFVARQQCNLLIGTIEAGPQGTTRNAVSLWNTQGCQGRYDKVNLVPFGEYLPLRDYWPPIPGRDLVMNYSPGSGSICLDNGQARLGVLICFESMCTWLPRQHVLAGAQVLVVPTNDAWFGETAELPGHFDCGIMRAVELHRPLIQAGNTGISGFVSPQGQVIKETAINASENLVEAVYPVDELTLYARWGDYLAIICLVAGVLAWALLPRWTAAQ